MVYFKEVGYGFVFEDVRYFFILMLDLEKYVDDVKV